MTVTPYPGPAAVRRTLGPFTAAAAALLVAAAGCGSPPKETAPPTTLPPQQQPQQEQPQPRVSDRPDVSAAIASTDPCAMRLHDICGPLLLHFAVNHKLPADINDLRKLPGFESVEFACPVTRRPYVYDPVGRPAPDGRSLVVLHDPVATHSGMRLAVTVVVPEGDGPLVTKVLALPESYFTATGR